MSRDVARHAFADRRLTGPGLPRHGLVDDDDRRRVDPVVRGEESSRDQWNVECLEVALVRDVKLREWRFNRRNRMVGRLIRTAERRIEREEARRADSGDL